MNMVLVRGVVRNGHVEVSEPLDLPDGMKVIISADESAVNDDGPMSSDEIAGVHAAMQSLLPLETPEDVEQDLAAWERTLDQHGIAHEEKGLEDVFR